ncbi:MAG: hypothetical protein LBT14_14495 [Treponema sp.]|jgi:hypothetical protein|nr:hypothetical protein [Treponema sp.]
MATKIEKPDAGASRAIAAANGVVTKDAAGRDREPVKIVNVRLPETDHNRLRGIFAGRGVPLATACTLGAYYIADLVEKGEISISRGGIIDRKG